MSLNRNLTSKSYKIRVGLTIGDPSGIGPAITLKAINRFKNKAEFVVIGDKFVVSKVGKIPPSLRFIDLQNINQKKFKFGKITAEYGRASVEYLDQAMRLLKNDEIDCLVTNPISKEALRLAGINYSGHTEYFREKTGNKEVVMMLLNDKLKFSLVTRHIALKKVSEKITSKNFRNTVLATHTALKKLFSIKNPRLVACGINPHASDNGVIGSEENKSIKPALRKLREKININGPLSADVAVLKAALGLYDCVIAMYHDQALIPLKLTGAKTGVNLTLGLPFVRTSPLHGTAFDIAKNPKLADPSSLISAIKLAIKCASNLKKV